MDGGTEREQIQQFGDDIFYKVPIKQYWHDGVVVARFADDPPTDLLSFIPIIQDKDGNLFVELERPRNTLDQHLTRDS